MHGWGEVAPPPPRKGGRRKLRSRNAFIDAELQGEVSLTYSPPCFLICPFWGSRVSPPSIPHVLTGVFFYTFDN